MNITNSIHWYGYSNVSILLQWDPPVNSGGTPVDNYTITVTGPTTQELTSQVTTATITVMYNEMYTLNVRTSNCAGSSSESTTTNIFEGIKISFCSSQVYVYTLIITHNQLMCCRNYG